MITRRLSRRSPQGEGGPRSQSLNLCGRSSGFHRRPSPLSPLARGVAFADAEYIASFVLTVPWMTKTTATISR
jgi:hypothetical protein